MRVLVLGGSGNFGARIVRALKDDETLEVICANRHGSPVAGAAAVPCVALDLAAPDFAARLAALAPGLVIHCVGPFQGQDYRVAQTSLACNAHYVDLADGRDFVSEFSAANDAAARSRNRIAISGASTLPALSCAVVGELRVPLKAVDTIEIAIAPGQRAARGVATLAAVFGYLGRPFCVWRGQRWQTSWGWMDLRSVCFDVGTRWAAACDVPDLTLLPIRHPEIREVSFHAALEFRVQHLVLWFLAALRRMGMPLPIKFLASGLDRAARIFDAWGGPSGGMRVSVDGVLLDGTRLRRTWQLTSPALHGPEIPCMAAILLARRIAAGGFRDCGARACTNELVLADFEPEFARWGIRTRIEDSR